MSKKIEVIFNGEMEISDIEKSVKKVKSLFEQLNLSDNLGKDFENALKKIESSMENFQKLSKEPIGTSSDFTQLQKAFKQLSNDYYKLIKQSELLKANFKKVGSTKLLNESDRKVFESIEKILVNYEKNLKRAKDEGIKLTDEVKRQKQEYSSVKKIQENITSTEKEILRTQSKRSDALENINKLQKKGGSQKSIDVENEKLAAAESYLEGLKKALDSYNDSLKVYLRENESAADATQRYEQTIKDLNDKIAQLKDSDSAFDELKRSLMEVKDFSSLGIDFSTINNVEELSKTLEEIKSGKLSPIKEKFSEINSEVPKMKGNIRGMGDEMEVIGDSLKEQLNLEKQVSQVASSIINFFSIGNQISLFKKVIMDAKDAVTELDAAMTQTAVVTDYSISDMWDKLPQYTEMANKLGATLLGSYQTMTLYYQQGI